MRYNLVLYHITMVALTDSLVRALQRNKFTVLKNRTQQNSVGSCVSVLNYPDATETGWVSRIEENKRHEI